MILPTMIGIVNGNPLFWVNYGKLQDFPNLKCEIWGYLTFAIQQNVVRSRREVVMICPY